MRWLRLSPLLLTAMILISLLAVGCNRAAQEAAKEDVERIVRETSPSEAQFAWFFAPFFMTSEDWDKWEYSPDAVMDHFFSDPTEAAGWQDPSIDITATTAARLNLTPEAISELTDSFTSSGDSGDGRLTVTADTGPLPVGETAVLAMELGGPIPLQDPDHYYTFAAVFDSDGDPTNNFQYVEPWSWDCYQGSDLWYELTWDPQMQEWNLYVSTWMGNAPEGVASNASAVIDDNLVTFFIPVDEFGLSSPSYRLAVFGTDGSYQPGVTGVDVVGSDPTEPMSQVPSEMIEIELDLQY